MTTTDHRPERRTQTKDGFMCTSQGQGRRGPGERAGRIFTDGTDHALPSSPVNAGSRRNAQSAQLGELSHWCGYRLVVLLDAANAPQADSFGVVPEMERGS